MTLSFTAILPIILVFVLYFLGLPIVYALFGSTFFYFLFVNEGVQPWTILQKVMNSTQSFWGLFFPFGIILGIRFAIFTPAEGGVRCAPPKNRETAGLSGGGRRANATHRGLCAIIILFTLSRGRYVMYKFFLILLMGKYPLERKNG